MELTRDMIPIPQMWRLLMLVDSDSVDIVAYNLTEANSLIYRNIKLSDATTSPVAAFQEVIYENPVLLSEFSRIDILLRTTRYMWVPLDYDTEALRRIAQKLWNVTDFDIVATPIKEYGLQNSTLIDSELHSFIRRTFPDARLAHAIVPLTRYFGAQGLAGNTPRVYVRLSEKDIAVVVVNGAKLLAANTVAYTTDADAVYYIMALATNCGFNAERGEIMVCGSSEMQQRISNELRRYATKVMPVVFPAEMFELGKDSMEAPYELIITPLCE